MNEPSQVAGYDEMMAIATARVDAVRAEDSSAFDQPAEGEKSIYVDLDGQFGPEAPRFASLGRVIDQTSVHPAQRLSTLHYLLRSVFVVHAERRPEAWAMYEESSKQLLREAYRQIKNDVPLHIPAWIGDFADSMSSWIDGKYDPVDVSIQMSLRPQIFAYSYIERGVIEVSAITREHLRTVNLLLMTVAKRIIELDSRADGIEAGREILDYLLPYVLALYVPRVNFGSLPIPRTPNSATLLTASRIAMAQVQFMLAHEFAHHVLRHRGIPDAKAEQEADDFAYQFMFEHLHRNDSAVAFTAIRWLFLFLSLDRIIGRTLAGREVEWVDIPIRDRELGLIPRAPQVRGTATVVYSQLIGDALLFRAKYDLKYRGVEWLHNYIADFRTRHCLPND